MRRRALTVLLALTGLSGVSQKGFAPNMGQIANEHHEPLDSIDFALTIPGTNAYFTPSGVTYHFYRSEEKAPSELTPEERKAYNRGDFARIGENVFFFRMDFRLIGYNSEADAVMENRSAFHSNYYLTHCPEGITNVPTYTKATYRDIYPNIDLVYKFTNGKLKYEFVVHPGGDINDIQFKYDGSDELEIENGQLNIRNGFGPFAEAAPYSYELHTGKEISSSFSVDGDHVSFHVSEYQGNGSVVIDPTVTWATYYNNGGGSDFHANSVNDSNGNLYLAYSTYSSTWPTINAGAGQWYDSSHDGITEVVITRFNADMSQQWATYYGGDEGDYLCGTGGDYGKTIDVDANDDVYLSGYANGNPTTFPTQSSGVGGAWYQDDSNLKGGDNSFLIKFDPNGVRQWGTLYQHTNASTSGAGIRINGIVCEGTKIYFTGQTYQFSGYDIPLVSLAGAYNNTTFVGSQDMFLGRFDSDCILEWSTYFNGGNAALDAFRQGVDITFDASGNMIVVGQISGTDPDAHYLLDPGGGAYFSNTITGGIDHTIAKFNTSMQPTWSTIIGGSNLDRVSEVATDDNGNILVACRMADPNMPTVDPGGGAFYYASQQSATNDGFIMKFDPNGVYTWGTYVGGTTDESSTTGISADGSGNIYVIGYTTCTDFPTQSLSGSYNQTSNAGGSDLVLMRFTAGGVNEWSTHYGGTLSESCYGTKLDLSMISNSCGTQLTFNLSSSSSDYPTVDPGGSAFYENSLSGSSSNALLMMEESAGSSSTPATGIAVTQPSPCEGDPVTLDVQGGSLSSGDSWVWYAGGCGSGASVGTGSSIVVNPTSSTTYYVRAEGPCGNTTCTSQSVTVSPTLDPSWVTPDTICVGDGTIDLDALITGDTGGTWSGQGVSGSTFNPAGLINNDVAITYTVGTAPCEETSTQNIYVLAVASATWNAPAIYCENADPLDLTTLIVNDPGGTWSGSGVTGSTFDPSGLSGNISITYTINAVGSCGDSETHTIDIVPAASDPTVTASADTICAGDTVTISASGGGAGATYEIYDAATAGSNVGATPLDIVLTSTTTLYVEAISSNGCVNDGGRTPVTINVIPGPGVDAGPNQTICSGQSATLTGAGTGSLTWSTGETSNSITVSPMVDTFYVLTVDNGTCTSSDTAYVFIAGPGSVLAVNDGASTDPGIPISVDVYQNDSGDPSTIQIISGPSNGTASVSNGVISYTSNSAFTGTDIITYEICDSICGVGCDTANLVIQVTGDEIDVPTGFTPNGDNINETWVITGLDNYPDHKLNIYNRWGDLVYSASPYNNDWIGQSENGMYGNNVIDGTYYYVLQLEDGVEPLKGYVEVKTK